MSIIEDSVYENLIPLHDYDIYSLVNKRYKRYAFSFEYI